ncbi:hypothetical protein C5167_033032 [Papaver somniferum]|uniref:Uncharacterized protein n=1 Tax=Papaver somniferum TaxID=3469 RepID=A0A4Y7KC26_PAPSO|nr:uncharacterized protein LOC113295017 [Papaver somniferum]RZC69910.1 hypothetical protein C5167_033032 [Papaver somniferum]
MAGEAATLPSSSRSSSTSLPKTFTYKKYSTNLHNNTISSYLNNSSSSSETFKNTSPSIDTQMRFGRKKNEDVVGLSFNSEKHFNGGIHEKKSRNSRIVDRGGRKIQRNKNDNNVHPKGVKPEAKPQKKSLAASVLKYWFPCELKKVNIRRFFPSFGCKCTCARAKSVDIEKSVRESKSSVQIRNKKDNHQGVDKCKEIRKVCNEVFNPNPFSLVLNEYTQPESSSEDEISCKKYDSVSSELQKSSDSPDLSSMVEDATVQTQIQEKPRKPLEVFGSPISGKNVPCRVTETPKIFSSDAMFYDGDDSDSSSDLFEIKNINFSRLSDSRAEKTPRLGKSKKKCLLDSATTPKRNTSIEKASISMSMQKRRDDILLSCRSYKAVNVARNNTYSIAKETQSDPQIRHRLEDSATPVSENRTGHARHRDFKVTHVIRTMRRNSFS